MIQINLGPLRGDLVKIILDWLKKEGIKFYLGQKSSILKIPKDQNFNLEDIESEIRKILTLDENEFEDQKDLGLDSPTEQNQNRRKNPIDNPSLEALPDIEKANDVVESKSLEDTILDLYEEYKKSGDPKLMEKIKDLSKHVAHISPRHLEARLARRKLAQEIEGHQIFNKIPKRKAWGDNGNASYDSTEDPDARTAQGEGGNEKAPRQRTFLLEIYKGWNIEQVSNRGIGNQRDKSIRVENTKTNKFSREYFDDIQQAKDFIDKNSYHTKGYGDKRKSQDDFIPAPLEVSEQAVKKWMEQNSTRYPESTALAEAAAERFGKEEWLDDPDSFIWEVAYDILDREEGGRRMYEGRKAQAPAMNPPAQMNYSYSSNGPTQPSQPSQPGAPMKTPPPKPTVPAPAGKRYLLDPDSNTWVVVPINQMSI